MKGQRTPTAERQGRQWQAGAVHTYMDIRAQTHIHTYMHSEENALDR